MRCVLILHCKEGTCNWQQSLCNCWSIQLEWFYHLQHNRNQYNHFLIKPKFLHLLVCCHIFPVYSLPLYVQACSTLPYCVTR